MKSIPFVLSAVAAIAATGARADAVTDWSVKSAEVITEA